MADALAALRSSVDRLAALVGSLDDDDVSRPAYPSEWTVADVASHLGSGAAIAQRQLDDVLAGAATPDDFNQSVWGQWNAKSQHDKASDGVKADAELMARLESVAPDDRARFKRVMGPLELNWASFVGLRLNEHLLHEWDIDVAFEPSATLAADGTQCVIDNLDLIGRFTAKANGEPRSIVVATTDPERWFTVTVERDAVSFDSAQSTAPPDLTIPSESFIRLVYGRLDPDHSPSSITGDPAALDQLRAIFPGP